MIFNSTSSAIGQEDSDLKALALQNSKKKGVGITRVSTNLEPKVLLCTHSVWKIHCLSFKPGFTGHIFLVKILSASLNFC
jgi:hypothetical protein